MMISKNWSTHAHSFHRRCSTRSLHCTSSNCKRASRSAANNAWQLVGQTANDRTLSRVNMKSILTTATKIVLKKVWQFGKNWWFQRTVYLRAQLVVAVQTRSLHCTEFELQDRPPVTHIAAEHVTWQLVGQTCKWSHNQFAGQLTATCSM